MSTDRDENDDSPFGFFPALLWLFPLGIASWLAIVWGIITLARAVL